MASTFLQSYKMASTFLQSYKMASTFLQSYKIVITRFFFPVLYFKLLRKIDGTYDQIFGMCAFINNKNHNYKPGKSFSTQNHLLILWKKTQGKRLYHRETQGKHREFYLGWNVATLNKSLLLTLLFLYQSFGSYLFIKFKKEMDLCNQYIFLFSWKELRSFQLVISIVFNSCSWCVCSLS